MERHLLTQFKRILSVGAVVHPVHNPSLSLSMAYPPEIQQKQTSIPNAPDRAVSLLKIKTHTFVEPSRKSHPSAGL